MTELKEKMNLPPADQIGFVVPDLQQALTHYQPLFGPFTTMEAPVEGALLHGKPADCDLSIAFGRSGDLEIELIAVNSGRSPHQEFLAAGGNGLHHIRFRIPDHDATVKEAQSFGYKVIWQHRYSADTIWSYVQKDGDPLVLEFLQMP